MMSKRSKKARTLGAALVLIGICAALGGYVLKQSPDHAAPTASSAGSSQSAPVPVTAAHAQLGDVPIVLEGLGTVTPINMATIRTQVQGTLDSVDFVEGQEVKRGDVLAKIDPRVFEAQVDQAEAADLVRKLDHKKGAEVRRYLETRVQSWKPEARERWQQATTASAVEARPARRRRNLRPLLYLLMIPAALVAGLLLGLVVSLMWKV